MNRRSALKQVAGGVAAVFVAACADGQKLLDPLEGQSQAATGTLRPLARKTRQVVGHTVFITVEDTSIRVQPETLAMTTIDRLRFAATNGRPFSIQFDDLGPFHSQVLSFQAATTSLAPIAKGRFKYTIVSVENPALVLDPVIIVEDPPTDTP